MKNSLLVLKDLTLHAKRIRNTSLGLLVSRKTSTPSTDT